MRMKILCISTFLIFLYCIIQNKMNESCISSDAKNKRIFCKFCYLYKRKSVDILFCISTDLFKRCPKRIRTTTNRTKTCCATITPQDNCGCKDNAFLVYAQTFCREIAKIYSFSIFIEFLYYRFLLLKQLIINHLSTSIQYRQL